MDTPNRDAGTIVAQAFEKGLLLNAPRPHTLRFMPALNVAEAEIDTMLELLSGVLIDQRD